MKKNIFQKEAKKAFLIELEELRAFSRSKNFNVEELCTNISNCKGKIFITGVGNVGGYLMEQINVQKKFIAQNLKLNLKVLGISNSKRMVISDSEIDLPAHFIFFGKFLKSVSSWITFC